MFVSSVLLDIKILRKSQKKKRRKPGREVNRAHERENRRVEISKEFNFKNRQ